MLMKLLSVKPGFVVVVVAVCLFVLFCFVVVVVVVLTDCVNACKVCVWDSNRQNRLVGLVVKASASGFESRLRRDFFPGQVMPVT